VLDWEDTGFGGNVNWSCDIDVRNVSGAGGVEEVVFEGRAATAGAGVIVTVEPDASS
jgi:hypothetical protein